MKLNPEQRQAVEHRDGPLLVIAGAGAGKTRVLTMRIQRLIESGVPASSILAITFTNKAAAEMRERVRNLLGSGSRAPLVLTFHGLGVRILKEHGEVIGVPSTFTIYDRSDSLRRIKAAMNEEDISTDEWKPARILSAISSKKGDGVTVGEYQSNVQSGMGQIVALIWKRYDEMLRAENALDFDDLIIRPMELLRDNTDIRDMYRNRFSYIHIDEYQDTNKVQYEIARLLVHPQKRNICVVGDSDQCLPPATKIAVEGSKKKISEITPEKSILCGSGSGNVCTSHISDVKKRPFSGNLIKITTKGGRGLSLTPNHLLFTRLSYSPNIHYVYLMYRADRGYRIGVVQGSRSPGKGRKKQIGLTVRSNQERADRMWILRVCEDLSDALCWEILLSHTYGIPTTVFHTQGRKMALSNKQVKKIYSSIDTCGRAEELFEKEGLSFEFPHYLPQGTTFLNDRKNRVNVRLTMFSDERRSKKSPWGLTRVSMNTTDLKIKTLLEDAGYKTRKGKRGDWRFEICRVNYAEAEEIARDILRICPDVTLCRRAILTKNRKRFIFLPSKSLLPSMHIAVMEGGNITTDTVTSVDTVEYDGDVFDLNVDNTHNYIANDILVHNCIYSWRGADMRNIVDFEKDFPNCTTITLEENYRSTQTILSAANDVIQHNTLRKEKNLRTRNGEGEPIVCVPSFDEAGEAESVVRIVREQLREGVSAGEVAVLYRTNFQSRILEQAFLAAGIPYQVVGTRFFDRKEVKDVLSYIRAARNPKSWADLERCINTPKRGIGKKTIERVREDRLDELSARRRKSVDEFFDLLARIREYSEKNPSSSVVSFVLKESGLEDELAKDKEGRERLENAHELVTFALPYDEIEPPLGLEKMLEDAALSSDQDELREEEEAVRLMTIHASKGLEFDVVIITGLEEGLFPQDRDSASLEEQEEERRLFYVALTRARRRVFLTYTQVRTIFGNQNYNTPSRFISDIDDELLEHPDDDISWSSGDETVEFLNLEEL